VEKAFIITIIAATLKRNGGEWNGLQWLFGSSLAGLN